MSTNDENAYETAALRAQELAKSGNPEEAERVARAIPNPTKFQGWLHEKTVAFIGIASALAEQGERERALVMAQEAVGLAELLGSQATWHEPDALVDIGTLLVEIGVRDEGVRLWMKAVALCQTRQAHDEECGKILAQLARELGDLEMWDQAIDVARSIKFERLRNRAVNEVRNQRRGYLDRGVPE